MDDLFDRTGAIRRPPYAKLPREFWAFLADRATPPDPAALRRGDGHVVLVVPAFLTSDFLTQRMRRFLTACGYWAAWGPGVNWGPTERIGAGLRARLDKLHAASGPVSVVGVSLGGVLARDLAYDRPRAIRQVITLASPFHLPTASTIEGLYRLCASFHSQHIDLHRLERPLPVPSTAIYAQDDGIVAWQSCFSSEGDCASPRPSAARICRSARIRRVPTTRLAAIAPP